MMAEIAPKLKQLESLILQIMQEVDLCKNDSSHASQISNLRFKANDLISDMYFNALTENCFKNEYSLYRFYVNIDNLKYHFVEHQMRWSVDAIKFDQKAYAAASEAAAKKLFAWVEDMLGELNPDELSPVAVSQLSRKTA